MGYKNIFGGLFGIYLLGAHMFLPEQKQSETKHDGKIPRK